MTISDTLSGLQASASEYYRSWFDPEEGGQTSADIVPDQPTQEIVEEVELPKAQNTESEEAIERETTAKSPVAADIVWPPGTIPTHQQVEASDDPSGIEQNIQTREAQEVIHAEKVQIPAENAVAKLMQDLKAAKIYLAQVKEMVQKIEDKAEQKKILALIADFQLTVANFEISLNKVQPKEVESIETASERLPLDEAKELQQACLEETKSQEQLEEKEPAEEISQDV